MTLNTELFGKELNQLGFTFYSGVPCSFLKHLINYAVNDCNYVMANNEGDAVAISSGAYLAGKKSIVLMQNSGLTNAMSPLTSLNYSFNIPVLGFVSLRGEVGLPDAPQHELMGQITKKLLDTIGIPNCFLSDNMETAKIQLMKANSHIENKETFFFIVRKKTFSEVNLKPHTISHKNRLLLQEKTTVDELPIRRQILQAINDTKSKTTAILATTGKTGRELYEIEQAPNNFYMVGSMGCISSIGLGISLNSTKHVIAIDGDGALLMRMGLLATNAYYGKNNLLHILIDNNAHDSTGGQFTVSNNVDFINIAYASGYKKAVYIHNIKELISFISEWENNPVLSFLHIKSSLDMNKKLGRPKETPQMLKDAFMEFLQE